MNQLKKDLMRDYQVPSKYIEQYLEKIDVNKDYGYSFYRSNFMQYLRDSVIDYDFFIHSALVKFNSKLFLIIGDKGCGKTSSALYFYKKGGDILTDELVYFKKNKIYSIGRSLSLDQDSLDKYFFDFKKFIWKEVQSRLNDSPKYILDIKLGNKQNELGFLHKIIVLVPQNNPKINLSLSEKLEIIERQLFFNERINNVNLSKLFDAKIEILMISELKEKIYNEQI